MDFFLIKLNLSHFIYPVHLKTTEVDSKRFTVEVNAIQYIKDMNKNYIDTD